MSECGCVSYGGKSEWSSLAGGGKSEWSSLAGARPAAFSRWGKQSITEDRARVRVHFRGPLSLCPKRALGENLLSPWKEGIGSF